MIVNCGDTFNDKGIVKAACLESYYKQRKRFSGCAWVDVIGNHDQGDVDGEVHPLSSFGLFSRSIVVSDFLKMKEEKIVFVAYRKDMEAFLLSLKGKGDYTLITHTGISGAFMNDTKLDTFGVSDKVTKNFKRVISGHYHKPHEFGNVIYVGSPMEHSFGEMGQDKSVVIYETSDDSFYRVPITGLPKHHIVKVRWVDGKVDIKVPSDVTEDDFVKVDMHGDIEQVRSMPRSKFDLIKCRSLKIESEVNEVHISRLGMSSEELEHEDLIVEKYTDFLRPDLDRARLMEIYREMKHG
jgi:DNA repair exonuclease SbcCD nuclease subunit